MARPACVLLVASLIAASIPTQDLIIHSESWASRRVQVLVLCLKVARAASVAQQVSNVTKIPASRIFDSTLGLSLCTGGKIQLHPLAHC